jgi:hypothetical protein
VATADTLKALTDLGTLLANTMSGKHADWAVFLDSPDFTAVSGQVQQFMRSLTPNSLEAALDDIRASQARLLDNRRVDELSRAEVDQYLALGNVALQIAVAKDTASKMLLFGHWLMTEGLPLLLQLAPIVVPLLI